MLEHPVDSPLRVIGRYALYGALAAGGMATVHFGRLLGPAGFSRTVAIKRLHPQYAKDPEFVAMFLDEARLAARIQHPNVVATVDVVAMQEELFLVMDYIRGESFSRLLKSSRKRGIAVPRRIIASVAVGLLHGLHAAHEAKDERGQPLSIVHRDVSPQNVLVGVDGVARVLDFGVAKAAARIQVTRNGQMKGKLSYMAPEQLRAQGVDRRTDVFAAGIVFWEALTGRRLFDGDEVSQVLDMILKDQVPPPSALSNGLAPEVDSLVLKALERDPNNRYQSAREFAIAIEDTVPLASSREVGEWVEEVAGETLARREQTLAAIESLSELGDGNDSSPGFLKTLDGHTNAPAFARHLLGLAASGNEPPSTGNDEPLPTGNEPPSRQSSEWDEAPTNIFDPNRFGAPGGVSRDAETGIHVPHPVTPVPPKAVDEATDVQPPVSQPTASKRPPLPRRHGSRPSGRETAPVSSSASSPDHAVPNSSPVPASSPSSASAILRRSETSAAPPPLPKRKGSPSSPFSASVAPVRVVPVGSEPSEPEAAGAAGSAPAAPSEFEENTTVYEPPAVPPAIGSSDHAPAEHPPSVIVNDPAPPVRSSGYRAQPTVPRGLKPPEELIAKIEASEHEKKAAPEVAKAESEPVAEDSRPRRRARTSSFFGAFDKTQKMARVSSSPPPPRKSQLPLYLAGLLLAATSFVLAFVFSRSHRVAVPEPQPIPVAKPAEPVATVAEQSPPPEPEASPPALDPASLPLAEPDPTAEAASQVTDEPSNPRQARMARRAPRTRTVAPIQPKASAPQATSGAPEASAAKPPTPAPTPENEDALLVNPYAAEKLLVDDPYGTQKSQASQRRSGTAPKK